MFRLRKNTTRCLLAMALLFGGAMIAQACPNCKDALESNDPKLNNIARGYFYSILFMLGTPPLIMAGFGIALYRAFQTAAKEREAEANAQSLTLEPGAAATGLPTPPIS